MFLFTLLLFLINPGLVYAVTPTPTEVEPTVTAVPTANTSEEIQKLREVVSQKVAEKLRQITNPASTKKAFIAKVTQIGSDSLSVDYNNSPRVIDLVADTTFVDAKGTKTKLANIKVGQNILVMGVNNPDSPSFSAKRIVFVDPTTIFYKKTVVVGKIVDVSRTSPIFTLIPSKNKNDLFQIKTDAKTIIYDPLHQKIKSTDLKSGQKIIAILQPDIKISKTYSAISLINLDYTVAPSPTKKP